MKPIVLITGASSGIGEACARRFAREGYDLILTARRADKLQNVVEALISAYRAEVSPLVFDLRNRQQVLDAWDSLPDRWKQVDVLVNNAGLALGREGVDEGNPDDWDAMIDTNIKGLLYVSRSVLPGMVVRGKGHVINIGSVAGREVYPGGNVYSATKFAVEGLSRSMRIDLAGKNIKVSTISPGLVETEFSIVRFKGDKGKADAVYKGLEPLVGADIAEMVWFVANQPPHVCINDINLTCMAQGSTNAIVRKG
jgi:3-hydroxy acid dehydrogenase / malonic semialdehyde reductase